MRDMQNARAKEYVLKNKLHGAHRGTLLYDRADMAHMQLDADQGADTRLIQGYLGHRDIRHTVIYKSGAV